jgi:hypothetical protein
MKFVEERPFASVDAAVRKLLEIANGLEADRAGWLQIGTINGQFPGLCRNCSPIRGRLVARLIEISNDRVRRQPRERDFHLRE